MHGAALVLTILVACGGDTDARDPPAADDDPVADGFDFPVGAPDGVGYYDALRFGANRHLGEDWNGNGGGDSDLGDPVAAIARGRVTFADDVGGGWGNVVRVVHRTSPTCTSSCAPSSGDRSAAATAPRSARSIRPRSSRRIGRGEARGERLERQPQRAGEIRHRAVEAGDQQQLDDIACSR